MSKEVEYTDMPEDIEELYDRSVVIDNPFAPEYLVMKVQRERITISVPKHTLDYFRRVAKEHGVGYQTLINQLLDDYVQEQERRISPES